MVEVSSELLLLGIVEMPRRESLEVVTLLVDTLELRSKVKSVGRLRVPAHVESGDTDRVTSSDQSRRGDGLVNEDKGEHAIKHVADTGAVLLVLYKKSQRILF